MADSDPSQLTSCDTGALDAGVDSVDLATMMAMARRAGADDDRRAGAEMAPDGDAEFINSFTANSQLDHNFSKYDIRDDDREVVNGSVLEGGLTEVEDLVKIEDEAMDADKSEFVPCLRPACLEFASGSSRYCSIQCMDAHELECAQMQSAPDLPAPQMETSDMLACQRDGCQQLANGSARYCSIECMEACEVAFAPPARTCARVGCSLPPSGSSMYCSLECAEPDLQSQDNLLSTPVESFEVMPPMSPLWRLLEEDPPCSIESLLDDEDVVLEFRYGNARLLHRLSAPEGMRVLLEQITRGPDIGDVDPEAAGRELRRRPWIVTELFIVGGDSLFEAFGQPGGAELLDILWSYLDDTPDPATAAALSGYFCSSMSKLLDRRTPEVAEHLRRRDPGELLECFIRRLESRSFADLLVRLICAERQDHQVFPIEGLVIRLISVLNREDLGAEVLEHIVLVMDALLARACTGELHSGDDLLSQFCELVVVRMLVDKALAGCTIAGCSASSSSAAAVLSIATFHMHLLPACPLLPVRSPEFRSAPLAPPHSAAAIRPPPPPPPPPPVQPPPPFYAEEDKLAEAGHAYDDSEAQIQESLRGPDELCAPDRAEVLVRELCAQMTRIRIVLDIALERKAQHPLSFPRAGATTLEVIGLLVMMTKTGCPAVFEAIHDAEVVPRCIEALFHFPWNNLLHNAVTSVIRELVAHGPSGVQALRPLLHRVDLLERIAEEVRYDAEVRNSRGNGRGIFHPRFGCAAHLRWIATDLWTLGDSHLEVQDILRSTSGWLDIVLPEIEAVERLQDQPLGGFSPERACSSEGSPLHADPELGLAHLDGLLPIDVPNPDLQLDTQGDEVDMNLEAMADAHTKRRGGGAHFLCDDIDVDALLLGSPCSAPLPGPLDGPNALPAPLDRPEAILAQTEELWDNLTQLEPDGWTVEPDIQLQPCYQADDSTLPLPDATLER